MPAAGRGGRGGSDRLAAQDPVRTGGDAPGGDPPERLDQDVAAHLRVADLPVDEGDRDLDDVVAGLDGAAGQIDLEAVALRGDPVEADAFQGLGAEGPVAA